MKKTIKKGITPVLEFECDRCKAVYESDEYKRLELGGNMVVYNDQCPECKSKVKMTLEE